MSAEPESDGTTVEHDDPLEDGDPAPFRWKANAVLFAATVVSVFLTGAELDGTLFSNGSALATLRTWPGLLAVIPHGWRYAVPLLAILLTHEFGHYIAARVHRVDASLPYFIPLPEVSPFGTMGAIIAMRGRIRSRAALLDIGASGPLAGLCVAIPVLIVGLMGSEVAPIHGHGMQEGQCLLYTLLKRLVCGPIPAGYDVFLTPMAFAGWVGLFVTMVNLVTVGQLDGGHIAYALFGARQNRYSRIVHALLLVMFAVNVARFVVPVVRHGAWGELGGAISNSAFWLVWYILTGAIQRVGGGDHPPTEPGELNPVRKGLAILSLVLFVLLFMPTPMSTY